MAETTLVSVDEFLSRHEFERCEYEAGVVTEKPMPNWLHGELCTWIAHLLLLYFPGYRNGTEVRSRLREDRWRLPDIAVQSADMPRENYAYSPPHLTIEVLSERDNPDSMFEKCALYHEWGVPYCWVIDGVARRAWEFNRGYSPVEVSHTLVAGEIRLNVAEVFSRLDS